MIRMFIHHGAHSVRTNDKKTINALPKSLWRFYLQYVFSGNWRYIIPWVLFTIYMQMVGVLGPLKQKWLIAMFERPVTGIESFILENLPTVLLIAGLEMSWTIGEILRQKFRGQYRAHTSRCVSEIMTDYLHRQSMRFWTEHKTGAVNTQINYISSGLNTIGDMLRMLMLIVTCFINIWLLVRLNVWITVIFAVMFVGHVIYTFLMLKPVKAAAKADSDSASHLSGQLVDSLSNSYIVRLFAANDTEHVYLENPRSDRVKKQIHNMYMQIMSWGPFGFVWDIGYGIVLLLCLYLFASGELLLSGVMFSISVYHVVTTSISDFINVIPELVDKIASAVKAYSDLSKPIEITDKPNASNLVVTHGKIEFKNVWFKYKRKWILRNFNMTIRAGERIGLVGSSGAGKTTLVYLLMRFWDVNRGQILIDGVDICDVTQDSLRRNIGFIPQEPTLFDRTLRENICYGAPNATITQMRDAARRASADTFIMQSDKKYDSLVGERGIKLSGGQKQRIAIARAFLKNAPILVLDEATSALDSETEVAIQKSFEDLATGRTTIAIAHRLSTLRNMDKIVVMRDGQIVEQGSHRTLLRNKNGVYSRLWKMQSGGFITDAAVD